MDGRTDGQRIVGWMDDWMGWLDGGIDRMIEWME